MYAEFQRYVSEVNQDEPKRGSAYKLKRHLVGRGPQPTTIDTYVELLNEVDMQERQLQSVPHTSRPQTSSATQARSQPRPQYQPAQQTTAPPLVPPHPTARPSTITATGTQASPDLSATRRRRLSLEERASRILRAVVIVAVVWVHLVEETFFMQ